MAAPASGNGAGVKPSRPRFAKEGLYYGGNNGMDGEETDA
jgi:hypothetical protein